MNPIGRGTPFRTLHKVPEPSKAAGFVRHVLLLSMPLLVGSSRLPFGFLDVLVHIQMHLARPVGTAGALGTQCKIVLLGTGTEEPRHRQSIY